MTSGISKITVNYSERMSEMMKEEINKKKEALSPEAELGSLFGPPVVEVEVVVPEVVEVEVEEVVVTVEVPLDVTVTTGMEVEVAGFVGVVVVVSAAWGKKPVQ